MRRAGVAALALAAGCLPVDYLGVECDQFYPCPAGLQCDQQRHVCGTPVRTCAVANGGCDAHASCTAQPQAAICACLDGFVGDGLTCAVDRTRLASLAVDFGGPRVTFGFVPGTHWYQVAPPLDAGSVQVSPVAEFPALASLAVNGRPLASGEVASVPVVQLQALVVVTVSAADGGVGSYTVAVRPSP